MKHFIPFILAITVVTVSHASADPARNDNTQVDCSLVGAAASAASYYRYLGQTKEQAKAQISMNLTRTMKLVPENTRHVLSSEVVESTWQAIKTYDKMSEPRADALSDQFGAKVAERCMRYQSRLQHQPWKTI